MEAILAQSCPFQFVFQSSSLSSRSGNFKLFLHRKFLFKPQNSAFITLRASSTSNSATYGGWDDPRIGIDSEDTGESNHLKRFLVSLGIDDRKFILVYILGFVCALAISRVRVSSIIVFPAAAIAFAIGFSFGILNAAPDRGLGLPGAKKGRKEHVLRVYSGKLKILGEIFDEFDIKVSELRNDVKRALDSKSVEVGDLEGYVNAVESIGFNVSKSRSVVEDCISSILIEDQDIDRNWSQKPNGKKKESRQSGFDFFQYAWNFVGEIAVGKKLNKKKDASRSEQMIKGINGRAEPNLFTSSVEEKSPASKPADDDRRGGMQYPRDSSSYRFLDWNRKGELGHGSQEMSRVLHHEKRNTRLNERTRMLIDDEVFHHTHKSRSVNNQRLTLKMLRYEEMGQVESLHDNMDFRVSLEQKETKASLRRENMLRDFDGASPIEETMRSGNDFVSGDYLPDKEKEAASSSSSMLSNDILFDKYLTEASGLLKQAKEWLKTRDDELQAERMLLECAQLLSEAIAIRPMSLLAVGQLGNTYLLHGEVKLRISRRLRSFLYGSVNLSSDRQQDILLSDDEPRPSRERIAALLIDVCEECEELFVEAGRKYRMALSIDGNDVRALYNWGLALSFRAQLIADIGPEAARDADKLLLAASDKFDAMMARSNVYAPDALFRWGVTLQQRSQLRPRNSKDKVKLLQQARRLYEDAIDMGSDNRQVREALSSCIFELDS